MVEIIVCVKGCCDEETNRLFSVRLVNSGKRDEIKSQQEELGLGTQGDFLTVGLHRWTRLPEITWVFRSCCGPGHRHGDIAVTPAGPGLHGWAKEKLRH